MADAVLLKTISHLVEKDGITLMIQDKDGVEARIKIEPRHMMTFIKRVATAASEKLQFMDSDDDHQIARAFTLEKTELFDTENGPLLLLHLTGGSKIPVVLPANPLSELGKALDHLRQRQKAH